METNVIGNISELALEQYCCGCTACSSICSLGAIRMVQNTRGFFTPEVDDAKCVHCGACLRVCQILSPKRVSSTIQKTAAIYKDDAARMGSSSGGVLSALISLLDEKYRGNIHYFGVAFSEELEAVHTEAVNVPDCRSFRGSKYIQSNLAGIYPRIAELLKAGKFVLFTGTGCQCSGLRNYLSEKKADDSRLLIVDLICHGVPSQKLWKAYLQTLESCYGQKVVRYQFRNKQDGWRGQNPFAQLEDGTAVPKDVLLLSYGRLFGNLSLQEACYSCKYANTERTGDITLGDYWGIEKTSCHLDDGKGVSLCLINTEKGLHIFKELLPALDTWEIPDDSYLQPHLRSPTKKNILCDSFWRDYLTNGYEYAARKYTGHSRPYRAAMKLWEGLKKIVFPKNDTPF